MLEYVFSGFALNVICLLPYLVLHYEDPTKLCLTAAENIAEVLADIQLLFQALSFKESTFNLFSDAQLSLIGSVVHNQDHQGLLVIIP